MSDSNLFANAKYADILNLIHSDKRNITTTKFFGGTSRVCLLDFIGSKDYFISEHGSVWNRHRIVPNKNKILTKWYLPPCILDRKYPYPWVRIPTYWDKNGTWVPINMLLGWAFKPVTNIDKLYAVAELKDNEILSAEHIHWSHTPDTTLTENILPSRYIEFVEFLYQRNN